MSLSNKRVLVTGATGLIGKELIKPLLKAGFEIHALSIDETMPDCGVHWVRCNLFDPRATEAVFKEVKPEYLLNFAWATTGDYLKSNTNFDFLTAGISLMKFFHLNGGRRAVYAGTCFEYDFKDEPLKEDDLVKPQTTYGKCKNLLREAAELYCANNGISFGWGRIFYVYGRNEHESRLTGALIKNLANNHEFEIKTGALIKDYIYSKDIAGAFVKFLDSNVGGIVNICTGKGVSVGDFASALANKMGKTQLLSVKNESAGQPPLIVGDNTRLTQEVGYEIRYTLDTALEEILHEQS